MRKNILWAALASLVLAGGSQAAENNPKVVLETNLGKITLELAADKAPVTVKNFLQYVEDKHFDDTVFHRVIDGFMIQGGGMTSNLKEKRTRNPIVNESFNGLSNTTGTIAMARTSNPNSATSQFFINVQNNTRLDKANSPDGYGYCVFGKVIDGMDVVDKIRKAKTGTKNGYENVPLEDIVIKSAKVLSK